VVLCCSLLYICRSLEKGGGEGCGIEKGGREGCGIEKGGGEGCGIGKGGGEGCGIEKVRGRGVRAIANTKWCVFFSGLTSPLLSALADLYPLCEDTFNPPVVGFCYLSSTYMYILSQ
jgi:hypothetical protein